MRKYLAVCIGLLGVLVANPAVLQAASVDVHQQYVQAVDDLHADGIATTLADIWPASAQDDQNAAPLYVKLALSEYAGGQLETDAQAVMGSSPNDSDWVKARAFIDGNPKLLGLVHKIASMPECVVPGRADAPDPAAILFPELAQIRRAARIIAIESAVMAHDGDCVAALKNAAIGFELAKHGYQEPILIGYLVAVAVDAITINSVDRIMVANRANPQVVAAAAGALAAWQPHSLRYAMSGEVVCAVTELSIIRAGDPSKFADLTGSEENLPATFKLATKSPQSWHDFVDTNGLVVVGYERGVMDACDDSLPTASKKLADLETGIDKLHGDQYPLVHVLCPVFSKCADKKAMIEVRVALAQACAAVLAYKSTHGDYPGELNQAMPTVPVDPFDQQPIRYRPDGGGFVLFSVGETGKYAGGTSTSSENVLRVSVNGNIAFK